LFDRNFEIYLYLGRSLSGVQDETGVDPFSRQRFLIDGAIDGVIPAIIDDNAADLSIAVSDWIH